MDSFDDGLKLTSFILSLAFWDDDDGMVMMLELLCFGYVSLIYLCVFVVLELENLCFRASCCWC